MQLIGPGLRDHADLSAGSLAVFGRIGIADHIEFTDGVNAQQLPADASRSDTDVAAARVFNFIQQEKVVVWLTLGYRVISNIDVVLRRPGHDLRLDHRS